MARQLETTSDRPEREAALRRLAGIRRQIATSGCEFSTAELRQWVDEGRR